MSNIGFNLLDEPWIPVLTTEGALAEASLLSTFRRAESIRSIVGELPTQTFAIHRLLLAILHRAVDGPRDVREWQDIRADWPSTVDLVTEYLETFRDRFDLFHPLTPFFQVADLRTPSGDISGLEKMIADVPNGKPYLTTRVGRGTARISAAEAVRWLIHFHAYDTSGIKSGVVGDPRSKGGRTYPLGTGWAGQLGGIEILGKNLLETLLLNLVGTETSGVLVTTGPDDAPPWELEHFGAGSAGPVPKGLVQLYTWQTRRVSLRGEATGVDGAVLTYGDPVSPQNMHRLEPMSQWRYSKPQTKKFGHDVHMPAEHDPARALWRGLGALLPLTDQHASRASGAEHFRPAVLTWHERLKAAGAISGNQVRVHAVGATYGSQSSVIDEILDDTLTLPEDILSEQNVQLQHLAMRALSDTDNAVYGLRTLARNLAAAAGSGDPASEDDRAGELAYALLDAPFRAWLLSLRSSEDPVELLHSWHASAFRIIGRCAADLVAESGPSAWRGRSVAGRHVDSGSSELAFRKALRKALPHQSIPDNDKQTEMNQ